MGATFGDVLEAITRDTKPRWSHILETDTYEQEDENGEMVHTDGDEWKSAGSKTTFFECQIRLKKLKIQPKSIRQSKKGRITSRGKSWKRNAKEVNLTFLMFQELIMSCKCLHTLKVIFHSQMA